MTPELHVLEAVGDPEQDPDRADEDQDEGLVDQVGRDDRRRSSSATPARRSGRSASWRALTIRPPLPSVGSCGVAGRGRRRRRGRSATARGSARRTRWGSVTATGWRSATGSATPTAAEPDGAAEGGRRDGRPTPRRRPTPTERRRSRPALADGASVGDRARARGGEQPERLGLDVHEAVVLLHDDRLERRSRGTPPRPASAPTLRVGEADLPGRPAGVVDRELEAVLAAGQGVRRMKKRPGDRDERARGAKNQRRLPMMSNTRAGLASTRLRPVTPTPATNSSSLTP